MSVWTAPLAHGSTHPLTKVSLVQDERLDLLRRALLLREEHLEGDSLDRIEAVRAERATEVQKKVSQIHRYPGTASLRALRHCSSLKPCSMQACASNGLGMYATWLDACAPAWLWHSPIQVRPTESCWIDGQATLLRCCSEWIPEAL